MMPSSYLALEGPDLDQAVQRANQGEQLECGGCGQPMERSGTTWVCMSLHESPLGREFCPDCDQPMTWFGNHWLCTMIKVHDQAVYRTALAARREQ